MTILNYQGSKKNLLDFIHENLEPYLSEDKVFFDIFSGTSSVGYSFKRNCNIIANDLELYSYYISKAVLSARITNYVDLKKKIKNEFDKLLKQKMLKLQNTIDNERDLLAKEDIKGIFNLYQNNPTIWNGMIQNIDKNEYNLFLYYYSGTYFGIEQSVQIDVLRQVIDKYSDEDLVAKMIASVFYALKETVFSKDGHMAQPLNIKKNIKKLLNVRAKNIFKFFIDKLDDFASDEFVQVRDKSEIYNMNFKDLINETNVLDRVDVVYADPPYTDMQYSRYYHILNVFAKYDYPNPTINNGVYTKGLYTENRNQSRLSQKSKSLDDLELLITSCNAKKVILVFSFAYPINPNIQKTDRYVFDVDDLINVCQQHYGQNNVKVVTEQYQHSNNRNKATKSVNEYLIICGSGENHAN